MKSNSSFLKIFLPIFGLLILTNCSDTADKEQEKQNLIFYDLKSDDSGVTFSNNLVENDSLNYFTYSYLYMGGGVATGDINNDGLIDIFFTGNQLPNKLYLNKGNLKFEDITETAGVSGSDKWYTGVTMADVNGDGYLDIYCSVSGKFEPRQNELLINKGDGTFVESAEVYGLADAGHSVQATFFDYDNDGDLDVYVANYPPTKFNSPTFIYTYKMNNVQDIESDHLYRNDGNTFTNVTEEAGVKNYSLSLSATVGDLNNDGWPDIYVSNDFNSPDFMYLNNQDGTFSEKVKDATDHTAFYGMGVDIADFNNDGNLDIYQVDMDAQSNRRKKANMASMNPQLFWDVVDAGFGYQYMNNCMQLNSGVIQVGVPHFSNVSKMTGTSSTDWSWGPLFADFDNDGNKDLFVTNGTRREINNNDYFNKLKDRTLVQDSLLYKSLEIPSEKIDNVMFKNNGNLNFEQVNEIWGIEFKGFSNGVSYADLDNDGDLEIITNNIDDVASIFENKSSDFNSYVTVKFKGAEKNTFGIGNRVFVTTKAGTQMQELTLTRGFQSSVAPELHFGLGKTDQIYEVKVIWSNGLVQILKNQLTNQTIIFDYKDAQKATSLPIEKTQKMFITSTTDFPEYSHQENLFDDFEQQVLLPHKMSTLGPALAVGDLNNDGLDDYFVGGASKFIGTIFMQTEAGFVATETEAFIGDRLSEDLGAVIFDADNDGDNDLYVVSGGYEFAPDSEKLQDRLYLNDGNGNFVKSVINSLPTMHTSGSRVYAEDFDKDGKKDLLILGRQIPGNYPEPATTYLLKNTTKNGIVSFGEFSKDNSKLFQNLGMATSAVITDYNNDSWQDLIIVGEWMPIRIFKNTKTGFKEVSEELGLDKSSAGWWWSINQGDFDNDGDMDYILGNNGLNYKYKATPDATFDIFANDFDKDNKEDIVLSYYNEGKQYPVRGRGCSSQQIPSIKNKFKDYESFSEATLIDVYSEKALESSLHYQVKSFASIYLENKNGQFVIHDLPIEAQMSSINQILVEDYNNDKALDVLIAGNLFNSEVETPRNDAGYGLVLLGDNKGNFKPVKAIESGVFIPGDVKDLASISYKNNNYIIAAKNSGKLQFLKIKK